MNKTSLLVAAGLMILATACQEGDTVKPATAYVKEGNSLSKNKPRVVEEEDSVLTNVGIVKPVKVRQEIPGPPYRKDVMPKVDLLVFPVKLTT